VVGRSVLGVGRRYTLSFDGVDDYVLVSTSTVGTADQMTVVLWTKPDTQIPGTYGDHKDIIRSHCYGGGFWGISTHTGFNTSHRLRFFLGWITGSSASSWAPSNAVSPIGEWSHLALVLDRDTGKATFYRNGQYVSEATVTVGSKPQTTGFRIALDCAGAYRGLIKDVRIYNRALSDSEIRWDYLHPDDPVRDGLVLWLPMNEGSGDEVYDLSGYNNHGTIYGATWTHTEVPVGLGGEQEVATSKRFYGPIYFGEDVNLYRAGAGLLKTDDNFDALALRIGGTEVLTSDRVLKNIASVSQTLSPTSDNAYDLGTSSLRWRVAYGRRINLYNVTADSHFCVFKTLRARETDATYHFYAVSTRILRNYPSLYISECYGGLAVIYRYVGADGAFWDESRYLREPGGPARTLLADTTDVLYFGRGTTFSELYFDLKDLGAGYTLVWEYWNGSSWATLAVTDGTSNFTADGWVYWDAPADWATTTIGPDTTARYYVRVRTTTNPTTVATAYFCNVGAFIYGHGAIRGIFSDAERFRLDQYGQFVSWVSENRIPFIAYRDEPRLYAVGGGGFYYGSSRNVDSATISNISAARTNLDKIWFYDGAAYTDLTKKREWNATAFNLLTDTNDILYFGDGSKFYELYFDIATAGAGYTLVWEYWNGSAWTTLNVSDGTKGFSKDGWVWWSAPGDWATTTVNGVSKYWVRVRTTTAPTTVATAYFVNISGFSGYFARWYAHEYEKFRVNYRGHLFTAGYLYPGAGVEGGAVQTSRYIMDGTDSLRTNTHWAPTSDNALDLGLSTLRWRNLLLGGYADIASLRIGGTEVITSGRVLQNIDSISQTLPPTSDNAYDLGTSALRWRDGFFARNLVVGGYGNLGSLRIGGIEVIDSTRLLKNVSADASIITSGRFPLARMPDGPADTILTARGSGVDPVWSYPSFKAIADVLAFGRMVLTSGGFSAVPLQFPKLPAATFSYGSMVLWRDRYLFILQGNNTTGFWCYDILSNTIKELAPTPAAISYGSLVGVHADRYLYTVRGGDTNEFYRYDIYTNTWSAVAAGPYISTRGGGAVYDGSRYIYVLMGYPSTGFYRYDCDNNVWDAMAGTPAYTDCPSNLVRAGDYLYVLRGASTTTFYRYSISANSWATMAAAPATTLYGALAYDGGDYIYALRGASYTAFWRYSISANSWTTLTSTPAVTNMGGLAYYSSPAVGDLIFVRRGYGTTDWWIYKV